MQVVSKLGVLLQQMETVSDLQKEELSPPPPTPKRLSMKILMWNCRGAASPHFRRHLADMVRDHHPLFVIITETRISGVRAKSISESLGFTHSVVADSVGFAGGIWLLWNDDVVRCDVLAITHQEIHASVQVHKNSTPFILSALYASPHFDIRQELWDNLTTLADNHSEPWLMMGDFNEVIFSHEKCGGRPLNWNRVSKFKDCIDRCGMLDLGFSGSRFTWTNLRQAGGIIRERLDRCLANASWNLIFPEAAVQHLARVHSDHCPVVLNSIPSPPPLLDRPFRLEPMWLTDSSFFTVVEQCWENEHSSFSSNSSLFIDRFSIAIALWKLGSWMAEIADWSSSIRMQVSWQKLLVGQLDPLEARDVGPRHPSTICDRQSLVMTMIEMR
ncbi:hypothetical protein RHGRI_021533 [Rhododendron griersonianum]|uniref:Endonuclease/exonuclease/phosphatase domain-containing protein n=1 Tax=Rhododendron griersonianum TaxID=479676 RepID=A0AAV6JNW3_9ERIC|nr:hypothetical protein RHGRI_021533 [Rhododendron griersonianum]